MMSAGTFACGARRPALVPIPDPAATAAELRARHAVSTPRLTIFRWRYHGREGSFGGEGALRLDGEGRARVDLLGPSSATVGIAVLSGDTVWRASRNREMPLPPPSFLWAMAGVFRPPAPAPSAAHAGSSETVLEYARVNRGTLVFEFGPDRRLRRVAHRRGGRAEQELSLEWPGDAVTPASAEFRDRREFRRIRMEVVESRAHEPFDPTLFSPRAG